AHTDDGTPVVEGMLDLVHLDHQIRMESALPEEITQLVYTTAITDVRDTEMGRVVCVGSVVEHDGIRLAQLTERCAIRGRTNDTSVSDPSSAAGMIDETMHPTPRRSRVQAQITAPHDMRAFARVSGDHNPIHTSHAAARLAGLQEPIVHGMWMSAAAQQSITGGPYARRI